MAPRWRTEEEVDRVCRMRQSAERCSVAMLCRLKRVGIRHELKRLLFNLEGDGKMIDTGVIGGGFGRRTLYRPIIKNLKNSLFILVGSIISKWCFLYWYKEHWF